MTARCITVGIECSALSFIPDENIAMEVDGEWWYALSVNVRNDARKDRAYAALGILVLRVPERELTELRS